MHRDFGTIQELDPRVRPGSRRNVIAVIGIDRYSSWPELRNARNDALGVRRAFQALGFIEVVPPLLDEDATGDAIRGFVKRGLASVSSDDNLVIFFAGHGWTHTVVQSSGKRVKTGYLVGSNGDSVAGALDQYVRIDHWLSDISRLPAHHVLVILDACKSGFALCENIERTRGLGEPGEDLEHKQSRRVITSALEDQLALDNGPIPNHSLFTGCLLRCLGQGIGARSSTVTGSELALVLQREVRAYPGSRQTPDFGAFELDDRGELLLPLPPSTSFEIAAVVRAPDLLELDGPEASLLHELAHVLAGIYPAAPKISELLAAHAPRLDARTLPVRAPRATWTYILSELTSSPDRSALSAILGLARGAGPRGAAKGVDWSRFERLAQAPPSAPEGPAPAASAWSHVELELRWQTDRQTAGDEVRVGRQDVILEATVTLQWRGPRPPEPQLVVSSARLFSIVRSLPHSTSPIASNIGPGVTSWLATIPIPRTLFRTQRITVRCPDRDLAERCYLTPPRGPHLAALLWLLLGAFSFYWLSPIHLIAALVPAAIGGGAALCSYLSAAREGRGIRLRWPLGKLAIWERAAPLVAAAALATVLVPRHAVAVLTNTTGLRIVLGDGATIAEDEHRISLGRRVELGSLPEPFCVCGRTAGCACPEHERVPHVAEHVSIGCLHGDCARKTIVLDTPAGAATITHPFGKELAPITIAPGLATRRMAVAGVDVLVTDVVQRGPLTLPIAPRTGELSIQLDGKGTLTCGEGARQIVGFPSEHDGEEIEIAAGGLRSRWRRAHRDIRQVYACLGESSDGTLELAPAGGGRLACRGQARPASIALRPVELAPGGDRLEVVMDGVRSTWTAAGERGGAKAMICATRGRALEIFDLRPGQQLTLPDGIDRIRVWPAGAAGAAAATEPAGGPGWIACESRTVRVVKLVSASAGDAHRLGLGIVAGALAATCTPPRSNRQGPRVCALTRDELRCRTEYVGPCRINTDDSTTPGGPTASCATEATPEEARQARARAPLLRCQKVYRCS